MKTFVALGYLMGSLLCLLVSGAEFITGSFGPPPAWLLWLYGSISFAALCLVLAHELGPMHRHPRDVPPPHRYGDWGLIEKEAKDAPDRR